MESREQSGQEGPSQAGWLWQSPSPQRDQGKLSQTKGQPGHAASGSQEGWLWELSSSEEEEQVRVAPEQGS